jgi:hypothetical protein
MVTSNYNYPKIELKNKQFEEGVDRMRKIAPETKESVIREALLPFANTQYVQYGYEIEYDDNEGIDDYLYKDMLEWSTDRNTSSAIFKQNDDPIIDDYTFKVYSYKHTITIFSLTPFSCHWDSGLAGIVRYTGNDLTPVKAREFIHSVVEDINNILRGEIYYYTVYRKITQVINNTEITIDSEIVDSCGGFVGDIKYCESEAKSQIEYCYKNDEITESNI